MTNGGPYRKPTADIYTLMLLISLLAIIVATIFLYLETKDYGSPPYQGGPSVSIRWDGPRGEMINAWAGENFSQGCLTTWIG